MLHSTRISPLVRFPLAVIFGLVSGNAALAQSLNWEGQTGALITPFAYVANSPATGVGHPAVSFHFLNAGDVLGDHFQGSATVGLLKRVEIGYTRTAVSEGSTAVSPLFHNAFSTFHGKVNVVPENAFKTNFLPAISAGFVARTQVRRVGGVLGQQDTENGDIFVVATKTIPQVSHLPILLNVGVKSTNASLLGIAGNAPAWKARAFGSVGVVVGGRFVVGSEFVQQPRRIQGLAGAEPPTTVSGFVRILPMGGKPITIDLAVVRGAGKIMPGVDLGATRRFGMGISYRL